VTAGEQIDKAARRRIESPCIGICVIDPATDCCEGCFRTLDEVASWSTSSALERRQILDRVERRRADQTSPEV
jgi:predicted Fe-S protein YdhL (DUF1289 family)